MTGLRRGAFAAIVSVLALAAPRPAAACAFHNFTPSPTEIDHLVAAETVALLRPAADDPYAFAVHAVLAGAAETDGPGWLVDAGARRRFAAEPGAALLAAQGPDGVWSRLGFADPRSLEMAEAVLRARADWTEGYPEDRFALAADLLASPDPRLRDLGLRDLDQAPYALLRTLPAPPAAQDLMRDMTAPRYVAYRSIRALMLGLTGDDLARQVARSYVARAAGARAGAADLLGPFATALVELDGPAGVALVEAAHFTDPARPLETLQAPVEALAIHHGLGLPERSEAIAAAVSRLLAARPDAAVIVARAFGSRYDWRFAAQLASLMDDPALRASGGLLPVALYVAQAREAGRFAAETR